MYSGGDAVKKRPQINGGFFAALGINLIFDLEWTIPAWLALAAHFFFDVSLWWFAGALAVWVVAVAIKTAVFSWLIKVGNTPDPPKENKNPYSSSKYKPQGGDSDE